MSAPEAGEVATYVDATVVALTPLADTSRAAAMTAYMKDVAPFLGIQTPVRRAALREAWRGLPSLDVDLLAGVSRALWSLPQREFHYAACDLIARHARVLPSAFLLDPVRHLVTTTPWWDTVDSLETAAVVPVVVRDPDLVPLMWEWLGSDDIWLVRTAVQHQRGLGSSTDLTRLYAMCHEVAERREFFVAKAVGWALRDASRLDPAGVRAFVEAHPRLSAVARREAERGLAADR